MNKLCFGIKCIKYGFACYHLSHWFASFLTVARTSAVNVWGLIEHSELRLIRVFNAELWPLRNVALLNWSWVSRGLPSCEDGAVQWGLAKNASKTVQRLDWRRTCSAATVLPIKPEKWLDSDSESLTREMVLCCTFGVLLHSDVEKERVIWGGFLCLCSPTTWHN